MREIDAWTDIFESQKRAISNSNVSKPGVPGQRRSLSKTKNCPISAIKTRILTITDRKFYLPGGLTNSGGSLPVAITARIGQWDIRLCQTLNCILKCSSYAVSRCKMRVLPQSVSALHPTTYSSSTFT